MASGDDDMQSGPFLFQGAGNLFRGNHSVRQGNIEFVEDQKLSVEIFQKLFCTLPAFPRGRRVVAWLIRAPDPVLFKNHIGEIFMEKAHLPGLARSFHELHDGDAPVPSERAERNPERGGSLSLAVSGEIENQTFFRIFHAQSPIIL